ncbi:MAG: ABC transporter permease [Chloroflexi bacterium]|nr:ABC transporter permease [Chloroflexota bacterium]MCY3589639.1 ABC transporter permease [Chloroflexota bacterium]MCY3687159.1 ABC transporter permease [Chloroflexota bacterium]MDE2707339.1 ABC transporter permease [Chloroflexota bacterium]MDE2987537.1 ABC transporter permease [Chloroflexota bacterium]
MRNYIFRRLMLLPITVILLSIFVFGLIRLVPGSVIDARLSAGFPGTANADDRAKLEAHFGLDQPVHIQYVNWIGQVFSGDFGTSWLTKEDILNNFGRRMPVTIELLILTLVIYIPLGIGTGVWSAVRQNRADDYGIRFITILFLAVPNFWLATLVIVVPLVLWGYAPPVPYVQLWEDPGTNIVQMIVPAVIAALAGAAVLGRVARSEMLEVLRQDYVRTAYSKGLADRVVILRHALRNTMIPLITLIGLVFATGIAGAVIVEQIFAIPGMGRYLVQSLLTNDLPVVQVWMLVFGAAFILVNLLVDISYGIFDPRIRFQ